MTPYPEQFERVKAAIRASNRIRFRILIGLGIYTVCTLIAHVLHYFYGIATLDLKTIADVGLITNILVVLPLLILEGISRRKEYFVQGFRCYFCDKSSKIDTNWVCGTCGLHQRKVRSFFSRRPRPFITQNCAGCHKVPHSFVCPHCRAPIIFDEKSYVPFQEAHKPGLTVDPAKVPLSHRSPQPPGSEEPEPGFADVDRKPSPGGEFAEELS